MTTFSGALLGPHIIGGVDAKKVIQLQQWRPRLVIVLDGKPEEARQLREALPGACLVNRLYRPDNEVAERIESNPKAAAAWAHHEVIMPRRDPAWNYYIVENEVLQREDQLHLLNSYCLERMRLADPVGYKCAVAGFSVGNPDLPDTDRMRCWRIMYPTLAYANDHGHVVSVHQYGQPHLWEPDPDWHIHRLETHVIPRLPSPTFDRLKFIVGEHGIDGRLYNHSEEGWQKYVTDQEYTQELVQMAKYQHEQRWDQRVVGYAIFTYGHLPNDGWSTYDIEGAVADRLEAAAQNGEIPAGPITIEALVPEVPISPQPPTDPDLPTTEPDDDDVLVGGAQGLPMTVSQAVGGEWRVRRVFTTRDGSWEPDGRLYGIDQESRDLYLSPTFTKAGADHHIFVRFESAQGLPIKGKVAWVRNTEGSLSFDHITREQEDGWVEHAIFEGYNPEQTVGPWTVGPKGEPGTYVEGIGMPEGLHVSTFVVLRRRQADVDITPDVPAIERPTPMHRLLVPVMNATVTQRYGARPEYYARYGLPFHNGVDYGGRAGDAIYAAADGMVAYTGTDDGYGNYIRIWHPDWSMHTFYAHLHQIQVKPGQEVAVGDMIATMGSTGNSTGPHLHFEIRLAYKDGQYAPSPDEGMPRGRVSPETVLGIVARIRNEQS